MRFSIWGFRVFWMCLLGMGFPMMSPLSVVLNTCQTPEAILSSSALGRVGPLKLRVRACWTSATEIFKFAFGFRAPRLLEC